MKARYMLFVTGLVGVLSSCTTVSPKLDPNYQAYLKTQQELAQHPAPIVEIKAQPGQSIVLQGVSEFVVYNPNGRTARVAIYRPRPNPATVIFSKLFDTALDASKSILPTYFGWHYGSHILSKAFDRAGGVYNVSGDYNPGTMTKVQGDYTTGTKYAVQGNYAGADYIQGDKVGGDKYQAGEDYVSGDKVGQDKYQAGEDYVGQNKVGADYVGGNKAGQNVVGQDQTFDNSTISGQ